MELASKYNPADVEDKWYQYWMENGFFHSTPDEREPYTIVIPPPNVTGVLHMGHMLNNTIQDVLVRRARMQGKNACWVPGTDHASIATEAKVVARLAGQGINKTDLSRDEFLKHAWDWTHEHGGIILEQLKKLGASCDWERTAFTMDEVRSKSVIKVFCDLYEKGLIYRGVRMVNWDPQALTAISDEEVIHKEVNGKMYYLKYMIVDSPPTPKKGDSASYGYQTSKRGSYELLKENAKKMRSFSTDAENALWQMLRGKKTGEKFRRQHIIGEYIVDFICLSKKLIVEVDGKYHDTPETHEADELRTNYLNSLGYQVIRFTNEEVIGDTDNVLKKIEQSLQIPPSGGGGAFLVVATTRPETIMGDTAVCIHPNNPKTAWLKGRKCFVPLINREIPIIEDEYVDVEFGTGCLKVTPAHDVNDYVLGEKYNLPSIDIFNDNGTLNEHGAMYAGMERFAVRKQIEKDLDEAGLLEKTEAYTNKVGFSERTNVAIEPKLSMQWFLKMSELAKPALENVENDTVKFHPEKYKNTYRYWMENIKDWNISRQLWWGHRIPAYYITPSNSPEGGENHDDFPVKGNQFVVAESLEKARQLALEKFPSLGGVRGGFDLHQDEDALDTWFSSWLWPISVFDGINNPDNEEINYYYPTSDLVTGPDIIFFWVARMIMSGYEYRNEECFKNVYFTGIVRDKIGRKMSKQLGNSPDPIDLMKIYGADGVRMGMLLTAPAGNDLLYDDSLCEQGRNFNNKIWNAFRLVKGWSLLPTSSEGGGEEAPSNSPAGGETHLSDGEGQGERSVNKIAIEWFDAQMNKTIAEMDDLFTKYRLSEALMAVYKLFWDEFSSWYLEMIKPAYGQPIDRATYNATLGFFDKLLKLLHPFMPFITEELWQALETREEGESIMVQRMPTPNPLKGTLISDFEKIKEIIAGVRTVRLQKNIPHKDSLTLQIIGAHNADFDAVISKICNLEAIESTTEKASNAVAFMIGTTEYAVPMGDLVNVEEEIKKMEDEIVYLEGFLQSVMKKLSNERFVQNAKPEIVENERKKQADAESKIASLKESIAGLKG